MRCQLRGGGAAALERRQHALELREPLGLFRTLRRRTRRRRVALGRARLGLGLRVRVKG